MEATQVLFMELYMTD